MKKIYIFGKNNLSEILSYYLKEDGFNVCGITLNKDYISQREFAGLPIVSIEELLEKEDKFAVILSIGYKKQNKIREVVFEFLKKNNIEVLTYIHKTAIVSPSAFIGEGTIILENSVVQPFAKVGISNIIWQGSLISHHSSIGNFNYIAPGAIVLGRSVIGNNCFIGANSTIRNDVYLGNYVIVGANAFADKNIIDNSVFVPNRGIVLSVDSSHIDID